MAAAGRAGPAAARSGACSAAAGARRPARAAGARGAAADRARTCPCRRRGQHRGLQAERRGDREDRGEARALGRRRRRGRPGTARSDRGGGAAARGAARRRARPRAPRGSCAHGVERASRSAISSVRAWKTSALTLPAGTPIALAISAWREPAELEQHQRGALVLGQPAEVGDQLAQVGAPHRRRPRARRTTARRPRSETAAAAPRGQHRLAAVAGDREQPRADRSGHLAGAQRAVGAQERLLERVLAVLGVARACAGRTTAAAGGGGRRAPRTPPRRPRGPAPRDASRRAVSRRRDMLIGSTLPERGWDLLGISQGRRRGRRGRNPSRPPPDAEVGRYSEVARCR